MKTYTDFDALLAAYIRAAREGYDTLSEAALGEAPYWGWAAQSKDRGYFRLRLRQPLTGFAVEHLQWLGDIADRCTRGRVFLTDTQCVELTDIHYQQLPEVLEGARQQLLERCDLTASLSPLLSSPFGAHDTAQCLSAEHLLNTWHSVWSQKTVVFSKPVRVAVSVSLRGIELPQLRDLSFVAAFREGNPDAAAFDLWVGGGHGIAALPLGLWIQEHQVVELAHAVLELWRRYTQGDPALAQASIQDMVLDCGREEIVTALEKLLERPLDRSLITQTDAALAEDPIGVFALREDFRFAVGIPFAAGRVAAQQLLRIADVCRRYAEPAEVRITARQGLMLLNLPESGMENCLSGLQKDGMHVNAHPVRRSLLCSPAAMPSPQAVEVRARAEQIAEHLESRVHWEGPLSLHMAEESGTSAAVRHATLGLVGTHIEEEGRIVEAFEIWVGAADETGRLGLRIHEGLPAHACAKRLEQLLQTSKIKSKKGEGILEWARRWGAERVREAMMADPEHPLAEGALASAQEDAP